MSDHGNDDILRDWHLDGNSTRHDRLQAAPSDAHRTIMWSLWAGISFCVGIFTLTILVAMMRAPSKVRKNTFNRYLFCLVVPDFVFASGCFIVNMSNAVTGQYYSDSMCQWQHFYLTFGVGANTWLNATVAIQLYRLLRKSALPQIYRHQYTAPTYKDATRHAVLV